MHAAQSIRDSQPLPLGFLSFFLSVLTVAISPPLPYREGWLQPFTPYTVVGPVPGHGCMAYDLCIWRSVTVNSPWLLGESRRPRVIGRVIVGFEESVLGVPVL